MFRYRLPLLFLAILALLGGAWAGLIRLGWQWPALRPALPAAHGPLMVSGFLGTLIALERAVALNDYGRFPYLAPLLSGLGGGLLLLGVGGAAGPTLLTLGSLGLLLIFGVMIRGHWTLHTAVMALGAMAWLGGNGLWLSGAPIFRVVLWWMGFLALTIAGERLELSRVLRLSRRVRLLFGGATAVFLAGIVLATLTYDAGMRLAGAGMILLAAWLLRYDVARRNLRREGLTRYIAACLFSGYLWLGIGGGLAVVYGGVSAGFAYDAILHAVFLGFVFAMIFGHAPLIFPSVLDLPVRYYPAFYGHLAALHLSLLLRVGGDVFIWPGGRRWGGLLNAVTLLLFLGATAVSLRREETN